MSWPTAGMERPSRRPAGVAEGGGDGCGLALLMVVVDIGFGFTLKGATPAWLATALNYCGMFSAAWLLPLAFILGRRPERRAFAIGVGAMGIALAVLNGILLLVVPHLLEIEGG